MELESLRAVLQSNDMEEVLAPRSADIFNIFCKKDGEHIDTIQALQDENDSARRHIAPLAYLWLERKVNRHRLQHQPDFPITVYEDSTLQKPMTETKS